MCLPREFSLTASGAASGEHYTYTDQQFIVYKNTSFKFPIHICTFEQDVDVDGNQAVRSIFREETGGGCGEIIGFATRVTVEGGSTYLIRLFRTEGAYETEEYYQVVEQSFVF